MKFISFPCYLVVMQLPTMAIGKVLSANNTSIIQDEVLAHKLGLIPIKVDPRLFEYMSVLSSELKWLPNSSELILATESPASYSITKQKTYTSFSSSQDTLPEFSNYPIAPKDVDIIIAKHGPGQEIELEAHVVKDIGMTHAKWSPVATAKYGVLPKVVFLRDIEDDEAETFVKKCPIKVFDMEDIGKGKKRATVARPRVCTLSRECIREEGWDKNVAMRRVNGHII
ncbi:DNA-directed RNA polymerases I and III subunit rpac1-like isoform X3 [Capsicum annuum]|uniref:DNA-directed RNA polymerases I and III subunit rpac1-like isoform X3 n=1 Tax=Capsicum annuum TaxID=4072 RepID=UPI001FB15207|nr:DNA-directed RNA polymerases I and III subunit rpac1-like isoform X3 [Capsicum annuum]